MSDPFRIYAPDECELDGYPFVWHRLPLLDDALNIIGGVPPRSHPGVKDIVRAHAGHRCERCKHPFRVGEGLGQWSPCDAGCEHNGPHRWRWGDDEEWQFGSQGVFSVGYSLSAYQPGALIIEAEWRILTVHHLNGVKSDLRWWNLAALCQRCHLQIQGKVQMNRVWPWEHSEWFKPHAAGWYAFSYLDEDLTREQVDARMDELLSLEQVA